MRTTFWKWSAGKLRNNGSEQEKENDAGAGTHEREEKRYRVHQAARISFEASFNLSNAVQSFSTTTWLLAISEKSGFW